MKRMRRKTQSKMYATNLLTLDDGDSLEPLISISGGRDFYLTEIVVWTDGSDNVYKDIRLNFADNSTDMQWQDKPVSLQTFVNNNRRLAFQRDLAHKTDVTITITNNSGAAIKAQVIFLGYELKIRPEGDALTSGV